MKIRKNALMFLMILFAMTFMLVNSDEVSAKAIRFNKTSKTITKGKSYTIKISGLKLKRIKKVTLKYNKKIIKVKRIKKNTYRVVGKKKGKTTLKAKVKYRRLDNTSGIRNIKCKFAIKNKKTKVKKNNDNVSNSGSSNTSSDIDFSNASLDDIIEHLNETEGELYNIKKVNSYLLENTSINTDYRYGFIEGIDWHGIEWVSEEKYKTIMEKISEIVKESGVTSEMTDQEKAWRIGRTLIFNVDYVYETSEQFMYGTLVNKKTVCAGYSRTYAVILKYLGIDCDYAYSDSHAWNLVKLGDYYYVTDLTGAYFEKNILTSDGVGEFFKERNYSNSMNEIWPCYKTEQYTKTHPVSEIDYFTRCKNEGTSYLSEKELYNLFH